MSVENTNRFLEAIWNLIQYYESEYDITYAEVLGCLELTKIALAGDCIEFPTDGDGGDAE
jgi:hypothetical protein